MAPISRILQAKDCNWRSLAFHLLATVLTGMITFGLPSRLHAYTQANLVTASDGSIETIPLQATVQVSPPRITIETYAPGTFTISRKDPSVNTWTQLATGISLAATGTWTDAAVVTGSAYEYQFVNTSGSSYAYDYGSSIYPTGYIICGIGVDQTQPKGLMAVVVASDLPVNLPVEYAQYKADLVADGWNVREIQVPRAANYNGIGNGAIATVKVIAGGTGSINGDIVYLTNSSGKIAMGALTVSSGAITAVNMTPSPSGVGQYGSAGAGFSVGDALTVSGGKTAGSGANLVGNINSAQSTLGSAYPIIGGSGYTSGPVTLTGQTSGKSAQCSLYVYDGGVYSFAVNSSQTGFIVGEFLRMSGNTTGSGVGPITVETVTSGSLTYVSLHAPGLGYEQGETATLTGNQSGKTAQVTLSIDTSGCLSGATIVSSQTGFIGGETLSLSGGSGTGSGTFSGYYYGPLQSVTVDSGGANYINGNAVTITYDGTATAQGTLSVTNGNITGVTVTSSGLGFCDGQYVTLSGIASASSGYNLSVLTVDNSFAGRAVALSAGGSGYSDNDTVAIKGATSGATAIGSLIAPSGTMAGVSVVLPNSFTPGESLTLTPSAGGSGAVAVAGPNLEDHLLIRGAIQALYNAYPGQLKNVVMLGKVPVCRSGLSDGYSADGHGNECPYGADAFYAEMNGVIGVDWTDTGDNSFGVYADYNIPGDKQFDQQTINQICINGNGMVQLGFGRIDLSLGIQTEIEAEQTYFDKLHRYKTANPSFLPGRMVCDRALYPNERETDLQSMPGVVGMNNIQFITNGNLPAVQAGQDADQAYSTQNGPFLFYFKGDGGPFGGINGKAVFWTGMQSHWGYWYQASLLSSGANLMQLRLGENSFTLDITWNVWGMRYLYHRMGMGFDAGDMMKQSINNQGWTTGPYTYKFNNTTYGEFHGSLFMNQMGDPALRLFMFAPPSALSVVKTGGNPVLSWTASTDGSVIGYHVYRAANANGFFTRLTSTPITATIYTDSTVTSGSYIYMVRAIHLENTGGGTFYNPSLGITQFTNLNAAPTPVAISTTSLPTFYWNTSGTATLAATGGVPQYVWTIASGTLPAGLTLSSLGVISGTPTAIGNFAFTAQATDQIGQIKTQVLTVVVSSNSQTVLYPNSTAYTAQNIPTVSYGNTETDTIQGNAGAVNETFHKYDLSGLNPYNDVVSATLYLYVTANTGTNYMTTVQANLIADAANGWVANGIIKPFSSAAASPTPGWTRINCSNYGFANGMLVTLAGLTGFPSTAYAITVIDANDFDIHITYGNWAYDQALAFATTASMTYNSRPTTYDTNVPVMNATGVEVPGALLQIDVTQYVREVLANFPDKQMGIRFFTGASQAVYVGSLNAYGGAIPYLVVQTSNAPNIVINSPKTNPAFIYSGQSVLLNTTVTPLASRAASLTLQWSQLSGPGITTFTNPFSAVSGASFSAPGIYVLQLAANDGVSTSYQTLTVNVVTAAVAGPTANMALRLPFDETSGTMAHDYSGVTPPNNGTLTADPTTNPLPTWSGSGVIGGALSVGGSGQRVDVADSSVNPLDGMQQMTLSMWVYANALPIGGSNYSGLICKGITSSNKESYTMQLRGSTSGTASPLYFDVNGAVVGAATQIILGKWYHIAMVFDGTQSINNLRLYINGNPDKFATIAPISVARNSTSNLHIGALCATDTAGFNGLIDEVRIYNTALTFAQIQALFSAVPTEVGPVINLSSATVSGTAGVLFTLGSTVTTTGSSSSLSLGWSTLSGPANAVFTSPTAASTNATCPLGGSYTLQLAANDGFVTTFGDVTASISSPAGFAAWAATNGLTGTNASETAVPAKDGIPNLTKYALNLNPLADGAACLPVAGTFTVNGTNYLTLSYTQVIAATDITYTAEVSGDLQSWKSGGGYTTVVSTTPNSGGLTQTVVVRDLVPMSSTNKRFIHLKVTGP